jgi:hypothetical protein
MRYGIKWEMLDDSWVFNFLLIYIMNIEEGKSETRINKLWIGGVVYSSCGLNENKEKHPPIVII